MTLFPTPFPHPPAPLLHPGFRVFTGESQGDPPLTLLLEGLHIGFSHGRTLRPVYNRSCDSQCEDCEDPVNPCERSQFSQRLTTLSQMFTGERLKRRGSFSYKVSQMSEEHEEEEPEEEENEETANPLESLKSRDIDREKLEELASRDDITITTRGEYKDGAKNYYLRWRGEEEEDQTSIPKRLNGAVWGILGRDEPEKAAEMEAEETAGKLRQKRASGRSRKLEEWQTKQDVARRQLIDTIGRRVLNYVRPRAEDEMDYTKIRREAMEKGRDPDKYLRFKREQAILDLIDDILNYYDEEEAEEMVRLKRKNELLKMRIRELKEKLRGGPRSRGARGLRNDIVDLLAQRMDLPRRNVHDLLKELFGHGGEF